jgi:hypothetical protein
MDHPASPQPADGPRRARRRLQVPRPRPRRPVHHLTEVHPALGVDKGDFRYSSLVDPSVYYRNGSSIVFIDLAPAPTDPNYDRFGSLSLTHVIIEEVGEVVHKARSVITSRKNRKLNRQYGITGKAVLTCNPSPSSGRSSTSRT